jgi:spermidine/putrescine transport system ATP-binding protein
VTATQTNGASVALSDGLVLKARWSAAGDHLSAGEECVIAVRPEVIGLWPIGRAPADLDVRRQGQVRNRIYLGDHTEFSLHAPELGELMVRLPKSDPLAMSLQPGDMAEIGWRADQALALRAT